MSDELNTEGEILWIKKNSDFSLAGAATNIINSDPYIFSNLYSCDIKTNTPNINFTISDESHLTTILIEKVSEVFLTNNIVTFLVDNSIIYLLGFVNPTEASNAKDKIDLALTGGIIQCTESLITTEFFATRYDELNIGLYFIFPALIFIDDKDPIEVDNKTDLLQKINAIYGNKFTATLPDDAWLFNFSYYIFNEKYLPKKILVLNQHINFSVTGSRFKFLANTNEETQTFYVVNESVVLKSQDNTYSFSDPTEKIINVYFNTSFVSYLELGLATLIKVNPTIPSPELINNTPAIITFISTDATIKNLNNLLVSSQQSLTYVSMTDNLEALPDLSSFPIKNLFIKNNTSTTLSLPSELNVLWIKNIPITGMTGVFQNLSILTIEDCGLLTSINLPNAPLKSIYINNTALNSDLIINDTPTNKLINISIVNSQLVSINLSSDILKKNLIIDISNNSLLGLVGYNSFLTNLVAQSISAGVLTMIANVELTKTETDLINSLNSIGWNVIF